MSMKCPACGKNHWGHCTDKSVPLWKRMIAGEYDDGDRYLSESRKAVSARIFAREVNRLEKKAAALEAENARLKDALERQRQGFMNLLEFRHIAGTDRYGALTREEIEQERAAIDAALGRQA